MKDNSLSSALPYAQFIKDGVLDLRGNGILIGYEMSGPSAETSNMLLRARNSHQVATALAHLGTGDMVHSIYHHLPVPEPPERPHDLNAADIVLSDLREQFIDEQHWLSPARLYLAHAYPGEIQGTLQAMLAAGNGPVRRHQHELLTEYALRRFETFENATTGGINLRRLSSAEIFNDLRLCITYDEFPALLPNSSVPLYQVLATHHLYNDRRMMNGFHLRAICIRLYPARTQPQLMALLLKHPGRLLISSRWLCRDKPDAQADLEKQHKYWNRSGVDSIFKIVRKMANHGQPSTTDQHLLNMKTDIDRAILAAQGGEPFGWVTTTVIVRDRDEQRVEDRTTDLIKEINAMGMTAMNESFHFARALKETWPGNLLDEQRTKSIKLRTPMFSGHDYTDITLPNSPWRGTPYIDSEFYPSGTPTPLVFGPFHFPTHVHGRGSQLIIGPPGSGKSTLLGIMACAYTSLPNAQICWMDMDYSAYAMTHLLDGSYQDLGSDETPPLCPLAMLDEEKGIQTAATWFERLLKRWDYRMSGRESELFQYFLYRAKTSGIRSMIEFVAMIPGDFHQLKTILGHYTTFWRDIFGWDPLKHKDYRQNSSAQVMVYEMRGLTNLGQRASAPATELILHNIINRLDGSPTWVFADEFWSILGDEISAQWLFDAIRTMRKKNASFVGCTQSLTEIVDSPLCSLLVQCCPGRIFLADPDANSEVAHQRYRKLDLKDHETTCIASLKPKSEGYYRSSQGGAKFNFHLPRKSQAICGATGYSDSQDARRQLAESGLPYLDVDDWLDRRLSRGEYSLSVIAGAKAAAGR